MKNKLRFNLKKGKFVLATQTSPYYVTSNYIFPLNGFSIKLDKKNQRREVQYCNSDVIEYFPIPDKMFKEIVVERIYANL